MVESKLTVSDGTVSTCIEIDRKHIEAIAHEYWAAKEKHPEFCSAIIDPASSKSWAEAEYRIKLRNQRGPEYADNVLMEEMAEAFNAYSKGDLDNALHEFAQVGAVAIRCMSFVMAEKLKRGNPV